MTFSKTRFFGLLILFVLLAMPKAFSAETYKEAWVFSYCNSANTYEEMSGFFAESDEAAAMMHYQMQVGMGACTDLTRFGLVAAFMGEKIVARHENSAMGKTVVIEGYVVQSDDSRGERAYIWVAEEDLHNFVESVDGKPVFEPAPPKFKGFHSGRQSV